MHFPLAQILWICVYFGEMSFIRSLKDRFMVMGELLYFIKVHKRYWLLPIVAVIIILSIFILATESSALAPFIYSIF